MFTLLLVSLAATASPRATGPQDSLFDLHPVSPAALLKAPRAPRLPKPALDVHALSPELPATVPAAAPERGRSAPALVAARDRVLRDQVLWDEPGDGALWVRGSDYKASIDERGLMFVPFLGSDAPCNHPVGIRLVGASIGGRALAIAAGTRSRAGDRVTLVHGEVLEHFDVALTGIEHIFEIEGPFDGDVEFELGFSSDLGMRQMGSGLEFANEHGGVRYGAAFAVQPDGGRVALASVLSPSPVGSGARGFTLRVPEHVARAAGARLVVDPLVSTFLVNAGAGSTVLNPDVAFSSSVTSGPGYLHVWEEMFSLVDSDVYMLNTGSPLTVDFTTDSWTTPVIASSTHTLVAAGVQLASGGSRRIRGRTFLPSLLPQVQVDLLLDATFGRDLVYPDLGLDDYASRAGFLLVCERDFSATDGDILAQRFDGLGAPVGQVIEFDQSAEDDRAPSVSEGLSQANQGAWNVVWTREFGPGDRDIHGARVRYDGTWQAVVVETSAQDDYAPVASPGLRDDNVTYSRRWLAVYQTEIPNVTQARLGASLMYESSVVGDFDLTLLLGLSPTDRYTTPAVSSNRCEFAVTWSQSFQGSSSDFDIKSAILTPLGTTLTLVEGPIDLASSGSFEFQPRSAGRLTGTGSDFRMIWTDNSSSTSWDIEGADVEPPANPICLSTTLCVGQPNSTGEAAALRVFGHHVISQNAVTLDIIGLPPNKVGYLVLGPTAASQGFPVGSGVLCLGQPIIRLKGYMQFSGPYGMVAFQPDIANLPFGFTFQPGVPAHFQFWYRDTVAAQATTNFSEAVSVLQFQ